jgi:hypothetical protein
MTSFWAGMKVQFYDRYLWPTKAAAIGDGARAKCLKRPASLWVENEAMPLGGVRMRWATVLEGEHVVAGVIGGAEQFSLAVLALAQSAERCEGAVWPR